MTTHPMTALLVALLGQLLVSLPASAEADCDAFRTEAVALARTVGEEEDRLSEKQNVIMGMAVTDIEGYETAKAEFCGLAKAHIASLDALKALVDKNRADCVPSPSPDADADSEEGLVLYMLLHPDLGQAAPSIVVRDSVYSTMVRETTQYTCK